MKKIPESEIQYILNSKYYTQKVASILYKYGYSYLLLGVFTGHETTQDVLRKFKNLLNKSEEK